MKSLANQNGSAVAGDGVWGKAPFQSRITVGMGSCGIAAGAGEIYEDLVKKGLNPVIVGCDGRCYLEPIVTTEASEPFTDPNQHRIVLRNCGIINPENIDEYIERGGYQPLTLTPEQIIEQIKISKLSGRGGAGFPTWYKWEAARKSDSDKKYIICNADEGDPGAFMDRAIIEGDPHSVIEGMLIASKAIGASEGIVYVRAEYPLAIVRLRHAIEQSRERGYLGNGFDIRIKAGAGAFVCGEETALIASIEGERGMPRLKPPFPAEKGYKGKPSNINNVETLANIPWIISNGGEAFAKIGTENSKGTKVFALTGKVAKGGLVEVPMGVTIRDVIYGCGGGLSSDKELKAIQLGGPSGGCIIAGENIDSLIDTQIDYDELAKTGAIMGSGGMVVMDSTTCMVDMARYFLDFTVKESCGKCVHCRVGNKRMLEILERICVGKGLEGDVELLSELAEEIKAGSLCALGQTAPNPVLTTIKYFRDEYDAHINERRCPAGECRELLTYSIDLDKCKKCNMCVKKCPANAICTSLMIDNSKCTKCGLCVNVCKFEAVNVL
jgi:NADH-quinone oxidoreductase subunit F